MDDRTILDHITDLVDAEHELRSRDTMLTDGDRARLSEMEVELDQCWDLLRQRRARREFGQDPDDAKVRDADTVEHYRQ